MLDSLGERVHEKITVCFYFLVLECLEEKQVHIIQQILNRLQVLYYPLIIDNVMILQENRLYKIKYLNNYIEILNILYLNGESRKVWEISSDLELNLPKIINDDSSIRKKLILYKVMSAAKNYLSNSEIERIKN